MEEEASMADPRVGAEVKQADGGGKCARKREEATQRPGAHLPLGEVAGS